MKLITDTIFRNKSLVEATSDGQSLFIEGIFAQAEKKNRNGRVYPKRILENAVAEYKTLIMEHRALGELNHPTSPSVNPERACIKITELNWNGDNVYGKAKVLKTKCGETVAALLNDGVRLGVSTRGLGSLNKDGGRTLVEDDYSIQAIDVVHNPSGIDCWVDGILENVEFYMERGVIKESEANNAIKNVKRNNIVGVRRDIQSFMNKLNKNI